MLCCESIVSSLFFFFSFFYTCKKKEFQSNFQINLVFFFFTAQSTNNYKPQSEITHIVRLSEHVVENDFTNPATKEPHFINFSFFFLFRVAFPLLLSANKQKLLSRLTTSKRHRALEYFMKIPRFRNNVWTIRTFVYLANDIGTRKREVYIGN